MDKCIFCEIVNKNAPADLIFEDDEIIAFKDINQKAPVDLLIVPKKHIKSINELKEEDGALIGKMILTAKKLAKEMNIAESGYKLIFNVGKDGGMGIEHLHLHLLGGKPLGGVT